MARTSRRAKEIERARYQRQQERRAQQRVQQRRRQRTAGVAAAAIAVLAIGGVIAVATNNNSTPDASSSDSLSDSTSTSPEPTASLADATAATCASPAPGSSSKLTFKTAPKLTFPAGSSVSVSLHTTCGAVDITMDAAKAPINVASFVTLARDGYFDHSKCHRLTDTGIFVLQCGDPAGTGGGPGPGYSLPDENLPVAGDDGSAIYPAGTIAMANNGNPNAAGSQFFLVYQDTHLTPSYSVIGTMSPASLAVLRSIAKGGVVGTDVHDGAPKLNVVIDSTTVTGAPAAAS